MWCHRWHYLWKHTAVVVSYCQVNWQLIVCQELFRFPKIQVIKIRVAIHAHDTLNIVVNSYLLTVLVAATLWLVGPEIKSVEEARKLQCRKILCLQPERYYDTFTSVYSWCDGLFIKSYLPICSHSRTLLIVISTCPVVYFLMSPVWQTKCWRICISHAMILK